MPSIDGAMDKSSPLEAEMVMFLFPSSHCGGLILLLVLLVVVVACVPQDACTHHTGGDLLLQLALAASLLLLRDVGAVGQVLNLYIDMHPFHQNHHHIVLDDMECWIPSSKLQVECIWERHFHIPFSLKEAKLHSTKKSKHAFECKIFRVWNPGAGNKNTFP